MYDVSRINSIPELEELISDMNVLLSGRGVDESVRKHCLETKAAAQRRIKSLRKLNGH